MVNVGLGDMQPVTCNWPFSGISSKNILLSSIRSIHMKCSFVESDR